MTIALPTELTPPFGGRTGLEPVTHSWITLTLRLVSLNLPLLQRIEYESEKENPRGARSSRPKGRIHQGLR